MLEAPHRRVLAGRGGGVERVHFNDPAKAVGLVLIARVAGVEALVVEFPLAGCRLGRQAVALVGSGRAGGNKVAVEVFFAGKDGAPGGGAARAVAERALDGLAGGVGHGLDEGRAGNGAGQFVGGVGEEAAVQRRALDVGPGFGGVLAFQFHDGEAMGCAADGAGLRGVISGRDHDVLVGVLVVGEQDSAAALAVRDLQDVRVVVVVAELAGLGRCGLLAQVEVRRVVEERVTPADDGLPGESFGNGEGIHRLVHRRDGRELQLGLAEALLRRLRQTGCGGWFSGGHRGTEYDGEGTRGAQAQGGAAGHRGGGDVAEVAVGAGVADVAGAGLVALERTGDSTALALGMAEHRQERKFAGSRFRHGGLPGCFYEVPPTLSADFYVK
ncbi:hypothetical protein QF047_000908 [Arthrobacter sp. W4I7]|nr:hypothetical protein [Arthrobacter sp. W4I7]